MENSEPIKQTFLQESANAYGLYLINDGPKIIRSIKCPYKIDYAIRDFGHSLGLVLKEEQIMNRPQSQIDAIMEWAQRVSLALEAKGIKCYVIGRKSLNG